MTSTYLTQRGRSLRSIRRAAFTLGLSIFAATGAGYSASARAQTGASDITIETLSTRPNFVTGGDVLVKISYPANQALPLWVTLNDRDITGKFHWNIEPNTWLGLVDNLQLGPNVLRVRGKSPSGIKDQSLQLTNYPISGPVLSGPHLQPYVCMTDQFYLPDGTYLGPSTDENCSAPTQVQYIYKSTSGIFKVLPSTQRLPADVATTTITNGTVVPYVVRF